MMIRLTSTTSPCFTCSHVTVTTSNYIIRPTTRTRHVYIYIADEPSTSVRSLSYVSDLTGYNCHTMIMNTSDTCMMNLLEVYVSVCVSNLKTIADMLSAW